MIRAIKVSILGLLATCAVPVHAQQAVPLDCLLEPNRVIDVSSAVRGVLSAVEVDRGDLVEENQIVARLDSSVEEAAMELAQARANANAEVQADKLNAEFAARRSSAGDRRDRHREGRGSLRAARSLRRSPRTSGSEARPWTRA